MKIDELNLFLDYIIDISKTFLLNDINVEVIKTSECKHNVLDKYVALVSFEGTKSFLCCIGIDDSLLQKTFKEMIPFEINSEEKEEMIKSLTDEVINTVAGLAISKFPPKYDDLTMSTPLVIDENILDVLNTKKLILSKRIETNFGDFICILTSVDSEED